jgi:hypothetical protein
VAGLRSLRGARLPVAALVTVLAVPVALAVPVVLTGAAPAAAMPAKAAPSQRDRSGDATVTTLSETGGGPDDPVTLTATVSHPTAAADIPVPAGTVIFYGNRAAGRPLGTATSGSGGSAGVYALSVRYAPAGLAAVVAVYQPPASSQYDGSRSAVVGVTVPVCTSCSGIQTMADVVPAGALSISTPYTTSEPLYLGTLALNSAGTFFSASAPLDPDGSDVPTAGAGPPDPTFNGITIIDTQASNAPWAVTAWASELSDGGDDATSVISAEDVGLTGLFAVPVPGNSLTAADLTFDDQPAADPPVGPGDSGSLGLGGQSPHLIVSDAGQADGTIGINGTITINAPSSTEAGTFGGTLVLTVSS